METVYIEQLNGIKKTEFSKSVGVCQLLLAPYGVKQLPQKWYFTIINYLIFLVYRRLEQEHCVFIDETGIIIAIYVNDHPILELDIHQIN